MADSNSETGSVDLFVQLLARNQQRLFVYVRTLVPRPDDAEEVLQNTNLVLWREFHTFTPGTNFAAWACRVALHQVLAWRKKRQRDRLQFSEEFMLAIAQEVEDHSDVLEDRSHALMQCLDKLPPAQREIIRLRYAEGGSIDTVAEHAGRTVEATYRALSRIRQTLHECVSRALAAP
ncbi:MAG: sigma-70 family RNA polymerase sigma factor [Bacteroidales bacterium]|nr:sigma-70 family RNA polymerase sigma factor [Bacteroidales bacterium]